MIDTITKSYILLPKKEPNDEVQWQEIDLPNECMKDAAKPIPVNPQKQMREALDGWGMLVEGKKDGPLVAWNEEWTCLNG